MHDNVHMRRSVGSRALPVLILVLAFTGCGNPSGVPEMKHPGLFTQASGYDIEIRKLGTLGNTYGPRLFPDIPEYDIPVVTDVGPIYVNVPDLDVKNLQGIEWHGYRLGGNAPVGSRSTATAQDWKSVPLITTATDTPGVFKVVVAAADPKTGRWKPESHHEYFGVTVDAGYKPSPIWAVKIK